MRTTRGLTMTSLCLPSPAGLQVCLLKLSVSQKEKKTGCLISQSIINLFFHSSLLLLRDTDVPV